MNDSCCFPPTFSLFPLARYDDDYDCTRSRLLLPIVQPAEFDDLSHTECFLQETENAAAAATP